MLLDDEIEEIEDEPLIDLAKASQDANQSQSHIEQQIQNYLQNDIPDGFTEIKKHLFSNDKALMY